MGWFSAKKRGTLPDGNQMIALGEDRALHDYQTKWSWPWANVPAHETRAALTNAWQGNQLPGPTNFVPGVQLSKFMWNVPTSYMNTTRNQQYNMGYNIQGMTAMQQASLQQAVYQAWQNRAGF